jgi:hypothetical protein
VRQPTDEYTSPIAPLLDELHFSESPFARAPLQLELSAAQPMDRWARITPLFVDGEGVWLTATVPTPPRRRAWTSPAALRLPPQRSGTRPETVVMMTLAAIAIFAAAVPLLVT